MTTATQSDPALIDLLSRHDARCPHCTYNLRGCQSNICPECGKPFTFTDLATPSGRASLPWAITLIAWSAALPWSLFDAWQRLVFRRPNEETVLVLTYREIDPDPGSLSFDLRADNASWTPVDE